MKRLFAGALIVFLSVAFFVACPPDEEIPGGNPEPGSDPVDIANITFDASSKAAWEGRIRPVNSGNVSIEWVSNFGQGDSFSLKASNISKTDYNSMNNAIRLTFENELAKNAVYDISYSVYAATSDNPGKGNLTGSGVVLNGDYAGATGAVKFPANPGTQPKDRWQEIKITTPNAGLEEPLRSVDFRFVVNDGPNHPDVWFIDNIKIVQIPLSREELPPNFKEFAPIKDVYEDYFLIGTASENRRMVTDRLELIKYHFNAITPGNEMKPDYLQAVKGTFTYTNLDNMLSKVADMNIIGHTLAWHSQSPRWMWENAAGARANLENHITNVFGRYGGNMYSMDVVNEALTDGSTNPADWRLRLRTDVGWYTALGADWVEIAFKKAAEVADANGWDVKLYYNDYNLDSSTKAQAVHNMVKDINERNPRSNGKQLIEGVGMQAHYNSLTNLANVKASIDLFSTLPGVSISITELDVGWYQQGLDWQPRTSPLTPAEERAQARMYAQLMDLFKKNAAGPANVGGGRIERVTFWGTDDVDSWRASLYPLLFDRFLRGKEALKAVLDPDAYK